MEPQTKPRRKRTLIIIAVLVTLLACSTGICCMTFYNIGSKSTAATESASISQTLENQPAATKSPTPQEPTQSPTVTPSQTASQTATFTTSPSPSPSSTLTPTPLPPDLVTQTAVAASRTQAALDQSLTATQRAVDATSTQEARNATATQRAADITATRQAINAAATQKAADATATMVTDLALYSSKAGQIMIDYADAMDEISELSGEVGENPYLLLDSSWKIDIAIALVQLQLAGDELGRIQPVPAPMRNVNSWLVKIKQETHNLVANYTKGIDNISDYYMGLALQNMSNINTYIENANSELQKLSLP